MNKEVIVINAVWCPSCLILKKNLKKIKEEYGIEYTSLDYDLDEEKVKEYGKFDILPVIIVGDKKLVGEKSIDEIIKFLKECEVIWKRK